jgi:nicotinate-nucleotide pyrophosphorylase (carboxylating)
MDYFNIDTLILNALREDMPGGDITTDNIIDADSVSNAEMTAKQDGIIAGLDVCERVFKLLDNDFVFRPLVCNGAKVCCGDKLAEFHGNTRAMLKGERTALNILQRMSGIATRTNLYANKVKNLPVMITDTRKTPPGLRLIDKCAVRAGGGHNHRMCLSDGVLIKDNHIKAAGGICEAVSRVRGQVPHTVKIEVETESLEQVQQAIDAGADIIMLDNMNTALMREAVDIIAKRALVEASGNITLDNVREVAQCGVDIISTGDITHSAPVFDISMRIVD